MVKNYLNGVGVKNCLLVFFLFCAMKTVAQKKQFKINWDQQINSDLIPSNILDNESYYTYVWQWKDSGFVNKGSLKITNVVFETLSESKLKGIDVSRIPSQIASEIISTKARSQIYTLLKITPIIKTGNRLKKVISFEASYSNEALVQQKNSVFQITNSVLAAGNWFKFKIDKTGVYKITKRFLEDLGVDLNTVNARSIKIYGNGGAALPLRNSDNNQFDLSENAIKIVGESDGVFDNDDYILFYGEGSQQFSEENNSHINPYDDNSYYYITYGGENGKRITPLIEPSGASTTTITRFNDYQFHEIDDFSLVKVGRRWFGNKFDLENIQSFEFDFPNIVSGSLMKVKVFAASISESSTSMSVSVNNQKLVDLNFAPVSSTILARGNAYEGDVNTAGQTVKVDLEYNNNGNPSSVGYLDYISIEALRELQGNGFQEIFQYKKAAQLSGIGEYQISNASEFPEVWDVTNPQEISFISNSSQASSFSFKATLGSIRTYVAIHSSDFYSPEKVDKSRIANQNLKGRIFINQNGSFQDIDYLIITAPFLQQQAQRLAEHRKAVSGLNVKVVTTDKIYEEFSSGKKDIGAIRNFVRYVYQNASQEDKRIKYLCLFGDASVDYKDRLSQNNDIVPTFHVLPSFSLVNSFMSDDFYGSLDPNEGTMSGLDKLDLAVGRVVADELDLAKAMVDKIVDYSSKKSFGNWRNNFLLISDDVDDTWEFTELEKVLDAIGDRIEEEQPFINVKKIHADAFQQESSAGGNRYPQARKAIQEAIDLGALVVSYLGHGGEEGLAKEFLYNKTDAKTLKNKNRYPLIVTVTCEFSKFDNPLRPTAGELTYWNKDGGAVALISTTREISVSLGVLFNNILAKHLFAYGKTSFDPPAEALRKSKNEISNRQRRVISYIGDPAMPLAFPKRNIKVTSLNGVPINQATDTLKALSKVRIEGQVVDEQGLLISDYNGVLEAKIFDKRIQQKTLANDGVRDTSQDLDGDGDTNNLLILNFKILGNGIFNGKATVTNGLFDFEFVVPRDIAIPVGNGRISLYAQRDQQLEDHAGYNESIKVGGLNENAPEDNTGPRVQLFLNDESFVSGSITNNSPILIAKLEDINGINTVGGIGHDIIALLDGDETNPVILNDYYQAEKDDFTKGIVNFRLKDIEEGLHTLKLKAWDVYNNSSMTEIQFVVSASDGLEIERVLNYPNPFINYTEFWFNHNRPFEPLEVQVQVFTISGKVVWTKNQTIITDGFLSRDLVWDGRDDFGQAIGKGVYVYKLTVKSTLTNKQVQKFEKLVIL